MICEYCKSEILYMKEEDDKTGLFCKRCGRWLKWIDASEKAKIDKQIELQKNEIRIDGRNIERVLENYKHYKEKIKSLNEDIGYLKNRIMQSSSEFEKNSFTQKVLKLKELTAKVAAYDEILTALDLKK